MPAFHFAAIDENLAAIASLLSRNPEQHLPTLLQGNAGIALFHAYWYLYQRDEALLEPLIAHLEAAIDACNSTDQTAFLGTGFTGLSWVVAHLSNLGVLDEDAEELIKEIRPLIVSSLSGFKLTRDYDLFYGFIGTSIFLAEDASCDHHDMQVKLLARLEALVMPMPVGIAWNSSLNGEEESDINLGLAHGCPSIIMFLLSLHQQGVQAVKCRRLIEQALDFLLSQELVNGPSLFPSIANGDISASSRLAWCYGDLGIAYVLLRVGKDFQDERLYQKGLQVALHAAGRDLSNAGVHNKGDDTSLNMGFCHGTAGIAFLFKRLYELTDEATLERRAQEWLALTLKHLPPQLNALNTDFLIKPFNPTNPSVEQRYGLLEGLAGIGLVLLAFVNPSKTHWSKLFLLNN